METYIMNQYGGIVCSISEAEKWGEDAWPALGDFVARFHGNGAVEIGRVGIKATMAFVEQAGVSEDTPGPDTVVMPE